jgi:hypothetical protein
MIIFHNPGLIPLEAIRLMGASVKTEGAFGRFGTGFKYAVATILRGGGKVRVWRGDQELGFELWPTQLKDKSFDEVVLVDLGSSNRDSATWQLGFTTALGKDWEPWMALRELACNARDEGGDFKLTDMPAVPPCFSAKDDETVIVVEWDAMDAAAREDGARVFAPTGEPMLDEAGVRVYPGPSDFLYHRGVRVWKLPRPSLFTYDVTAAVDLTEDRTVKYGFCVVANVRNMILATEDRSIIAAAVTAKEKTWEAAFDWTGKEWNATEPGQTWLEEVAHLRQTAILGVSKSASDVCVAHSAYSTSKSYYGDYDEPAGNFAEAVEQIKDKLGIDLTKTNTFVADELPGGIASVIRNGSIFVVKELLDAPLFLIARELVSRWFELQSGGNHDELLKVVVPLLLDTDYDFKREREELAARAAGIVPSIVEWLLGVTPRLADEEPQPTLASGGDVPF